MIRGLLVLLVCLLPAAAFADGGVYIHKTAVAQNVTIPDQQAILCWSNGVERLAIQTQFAATGTNFAWVVPLPSKPVIEEATTGVFTTVEYLFRPNVIHELMPYYAILLVCIGVAYLLITVRRNTPFRISDALVPITIALLLIPISGCISVFLLVLLPYSVWRIRMDKESRWSIVAALIFGVVFGAMLLPSLGVRPRAASSGSGVSILSQQTVGIYDTATIAAKDPEALREWFDENGYVLPPAANVVVSNYVKRGWVFAAAKVRRDSASESTNAPHPLCFTFASDKPIYPMQLTAIGNPQLKVDLFVFGPSRATAKNFRAERCTKPQFIDPADHYPRSTELRIAHPVIRHWAGSLPVATKLSATLTQQMMGDDVEIAWQPFKETGRNVYSRQGAAVFAANCGASVFAVVLLIASLVTAFKRVWQSRLKFVALLTAAAAVITASIIFAAVPKTSVKLVLLPRIRTFNNLRLLSVQHETNVPTNGFSMTMTQLRAELDKELNPETNHYVQNYVENFLLGGRIHEEDSPGNYVLRETTNGVQFVWFDEQGGEHAEK